MVGQAIDFDDAIDVFINCSPDLILLDINLKGKKNRDRYCSLYK